MSAASVIPNSLTTLLSAEQLKAAVAAQLREVIGCADRPTVLATAALALSQIQRVIAGVRGGAGPAPSALNTSWEIDVAADSLAARRWPRHPLCGCWNRRG